MLPLKGIALLHDLSTGMFSTCRARAFALTPTFLRTAKFAVISCTVNAADISAIIPVCLDRPEEKTLSGIKADKLSTNESC